MTRIGAARAGPLGLALLASACASAPEAAPTVTVTTRPEVRLSLQLRSGPGAWPCKSLGAGLEACPVGVTTEEIRFLPGDELVRASIDGRAPPPDRVFEQAFRQLDRDAGPLRIAWLGDASQPRRLGVVTREGGVDDFAAAWLLLLPVRTDELVDHVGLQFLAAVPSRRTLLVLRDDDPDARALAELVMAEHARTEPPLLPGVFFQVTPEGLVPR